MTGQQLKNSILQWAIEGKLVPQIESEGSAEDLLKEIRAERYNKIKSGKIKLSKPEKGIKVKTDQEFDLPPTWTWCILSDVCRVFGRIGFRGYTKEDLVKEKEGAISLSPSNMKENGLVFDNSTYISWDKYEESPEIKIHEGDILIVKTGSSYGKTSLVEKLLWKCTINPQIAVIKDITINGRFLKYVLESPYCRNKFESFVLGTSIPTFSQLNLLGLNIPLPPLSEQHRIVAKIEELMTLVEEYGKAQERLVALNKELPEKLKKSVLQEAIMGKLVPQDPKEGTAEDLLAEIRKEKEKLVKEGKLKKKDLEVKPIEDDEIPFEIPEGWRWCRLGEIGSWGSGATPAKGKPEYYTNGNIPWLRTGELNNDYVYDSEIKVTQAALDECSLRMCRKGDVLIAMYGATIGKVAIAGIELTTNQACCACTPLFIYNKYLMWYLMASKQAFIDLGEGGAQPNISREKIVAFPFALPPLAEQKRIVAKVEEVMREIEGMKK